MPGLLDIRASSFARLYTQTYYVLIVAYYIYTSPRQPTPMPPSPPSSAAADQWNIDYVNEEYVPSPSAPLAAHPLTSHLKAFAQALSYNDVQPLDGDSSPLSPRSFSLPPESPQLSTASVKAPPPTWKYGPDNGTLRSGRDTEERVEKLTATSDFAVRTKSLGL